MFPGKDDQSQDSYNRYKPEETPMFADMRIHFANFEPTSVAIASESTCLIAPRLISKQNQLITGFQYHEDIGSKNLESIHNIFTHKEFTFIQTANSLFTTGYTIAELFQKSPKRRHFVNVSKFILAGCDHLYAKPQTIYNFTLPKQFQFLYFDRKLVLFKLGRKLILRPIEPPPKRGSDEAVLAYYYQWKSGQAPKIQEVELDTLDDRFIAVDADHSNEKIYLYDCQGRICTLQKGISSSRLIFVKKVAACKYVRMFFYQNKAFMIDIYGRLKIVDLYEDPQVRGSPQKENHRTSITGYMRVNVRKVNRHKSQISQALSGSQTQTQTDLTAAAALMEIQQSENPCDRHISNDFKAENIHKVKDKQTATSLIAIRRARKMQQTYDKVFSKNDITLAKIIQTENERRKRVFNAHLFSFTKSNNHSESNDPKITTFQLPQKRRDAIALNPKEVACVSERGEVSESYQATAGNFRRGALKWPKPMQKFSIPDDIIIKVFLTPYLNILLVLTRSGALYKLSHAQSEFQLSQISVPGVKVFNVSFSDARIFLHCSKDSDESAVTKIAYLPLSDFRKIKSHQKVSFYKYCA